MHSKIKNIIINIFSLFRIKNIILLESVPDYADSSKVFFEYLIKNKINNNYRIYWMVDNKDKFKNYKYFNVKYIECLKKDNFFSKLKIFHLSIHAKYIFVCNRHIKKYNKKTIYVYFTHGIPFKYVKNIKMVSPSVDYIISPSEYWQDIFSNQFNVCKNKILPLGQPRYDILFEKEKNKRIDFLNKKYKKIILWLPTFRQHKNKLREDIDFKFPYGIPLIHNEDDLIKLNNYLVKNNYLLILKNHPAQDVSLIKKVDSPNILLISDSDLFRNNIILSNLIYLCDTLMTDYSSVFYEGICINKELIFTIDDFLNYKKNRGFITDNPDFYMVGDKVSNINELISSLENYKKKDKYKEIRKERSNLFFDYHDNLSSKRICDYFKIK